MQDKLKLSEFFLQEGKTSPPKLLSETELITLMNANGIGTDATMHEHIKTIQERKYAVHLNGHFSPTSLGVALVESYNSLGIDLAKPFSRQMME